MPNPPPNPPFVLALDVGTSATRALLFDGEARLVPGCVASLPNRLRHTTDGGSEFDPQHLLENAIAAVDRVLDQAAAALGDLAAASAAIRAVAVATFAGNLLGIDGQGRPLTPVYTYADTRAADAVSALKRELNADELAASHDRTGCLLHAAYLPARFRWLAETQPDLLDAVAEWTTIGDYLRRHFCGARGVSLSLASWNGLLNRRELTWDAAWIKRLPVRRAALPPLVDVGDAARLQSPWSGRWVALREAAWLPAIGDGAAANLGSGADGTTPDGVHQIALTVGSTAAMRMVVEPTIERVPDGLWLYRVDAARGLLGGATSEGGNVYGWLRGLLDWPDEDALSRDLTAPLLTASSTTRSPAAHDLTVLPFVAGERAPGWRANARATLHGLALDTTPLDILQATLEAVAYRLALIQQRIVAHLPEDAAYRIMAGGGALRRSPAWRQILADAMGYPIVALDEDEITGRGLALLALAQVGAIDSVAALPPRIGETHEPNATHHALHRERLAQQIALYERVMA